MPRRCWMKTGHRRLADVPVAMDPGVDQQADGGGAKLRFFQAAAPGFDGVADRAPAPEMPARQADAQAGDAAGAHGQPPSARRSR